MAEEPLGADRWDAVAEDYGATPVALRLAHGLVDFAAVAVGEAVLDVGTGTGLALRHAGKAGGDGFFVGVDRSFRMLQAAAVSISEEGSPGGWLARSDARSLPFTAGCFDVVLAASVWQFVGYSADALDEWRRVLCDGGRLGLSVPAPGSGASLPADLMTKYFPHLSPAAQDDFLARAAQSRPLPELPEAMREVGFSEARVVERSWDETFPGPEDWWALQWTHGVRFFLEALEPEALSALKGEALERLPRTDSGAVTLPTKVRYCLAQR